MPANIVDKLRIKKGYVLRVLNAPANFQKMLGDLPEEVVISAEAKTYDQIHWFVKDKTALEAKVDEVVGVLKNGVVCWIYYPKRTSQIQTDLTRDKGWESLLKYKQLQRISLISFDAIWSAFGTRLKAPGDKKKESMPKEREIFKYVNAATKTISLPDDFSAALQAHKKALGFFTGLSFTNKKEYLEWIVTARREQTRATRVKESIEKLVKGWKNPANR
jgi:hypothetical protein